jgi:hypothetical protein
LAWEQDEEKMVELPSELDQLHAMGDRKFGNASGRHHSSSSRYLNEKGHGRSDGNGNRSGSSGSGSNSNGRRVSAHKGRSSSLETADKRRTETALTAVATAAAAAAAASEEQDAMTEKISRLKSELDELDQLLYGKKRHR